MNDSDPADRTLDCVRTLIATTQDIQNAGAQADAADARLKNTVRRTHSCPFRDFVKHLADADWISFPQLQHDARSLLNKETQP